MPSEIQPPDTLQESKPVSAMTSPDRTPTAHPATPDDQATAPNDDLSLVPSTASSPSIRRSRSTNSALAFLLSSLEATSPRRTRPAIEAPQSPPSSSPPPTDRPHAPSPQPKSAYSFVGASLASSSTRQSLYDRSGTSSPPGSNGTGANIAGAARTAEPSSPPRRPTSAPPGGKPSMTPASPGRADASSHGEPPRTPRRSATSAEGASPPRAANGTAGAGAAPGSTNAGTSSVTSGVAAAVQHAVRAPTAAAVDAVLLVVSLWITVGAVCVITAFSYGLTALDTVGPLVATGWTGALRVVTPAARAGFIAFRYGRDTLVGSADEVVRRLRRRGGKAAQGKEGMKTAS